MIFHRVYGPYIDHLGWFKPNKALYDDTSNGNIVSVHRNIEPISYIIREICMGVGFTLRSDPKLHTITSVIVNVYYTRRWFIVHKIFESTNTVFLRPKNCNPFAV